MKKPYHARPSHTFPPEFGFTGSTGKVTSVTAHTRGLPIKKGAGGMARRPRVPLKRVVDQIVDSMPPPAMPNAAAASPLAAMARMAPRRGPNLPMMASTTMKKGGRAFSKAPMFGKKDC
jgi:hypothetical protein